MNNKTLIVAGISALAISALSVSGLVSAANTVSTPNNKSPQTQSQQFKGKKGMMRWEMKGWQFWPGRGQWFDGQHGGPRWMFGWENSAVKAAIDANDYTAFVKARNADTNKPSDATVPTQDQFNQMVSHAKKEVAVEAALKANDYNAFVKATTPTVPTQDQFNQMVEHTTAKTANK